MTGTRSSKAATRAEIDQRFGDYSISAATTFGPRLTGLRRKDSPEILARLSGDVGIDLPDGRFYRFHGGHRLWAAPEAPETTYAPDDLACELEVADGRITIKGQTDRVGFAKRLEVSMQGDRLLVEHRLEWNGDAPIEAAPWAITQFPVGGTALLRLSGLAGASPLEADRSMIIWPYTDLSDQRIRLTERDVLISADPGPPLKLGAGPDPGRMGYLRGGHLFIKSFEPGSGQGHPDRGAVGQVYANEYFCELESTGPLVLMEPGSSTTHFETWEVVACPDLAAAIEIVDRGNSG